MYGAVYLLVYKSERRRSNEAGVKPLFDLPRHEKNFLCMPHTFFHRCTVVGVVSSIVSSLSRSLRTWSYLSRSCLPCRESRLFSFWRGRRVFSPRALLLARSKALFLRGLDFELKFYSRRRASIMRYFFVGCTRVRNKRGASVLLENFSATRRDYIVSIFWKLYFSSSGDHSCRIMAIAPQRGNRFSWASLMARWKFQMCGVRFLPRDRVWIVPKL